VVVVAGSPSIEDGGYWWYRARADLLEAALGSHVRPATRLLDVGSADGPSVAWLRRRVEHVALDLDPRGLRPGGVCGSALMLPFAASSFDAVAAFDVVEHCVPEQQALSELVRVLRPGGRLLVAVPAYTWAWTSHDDRNGHHRRYTRSRLLAAVEGAGLRVDRATYAFASTFPFFAADRLTRRVRERAHRPPSLDGGAVPPLPAVHPAVERVLLALSRAEARVLAGRDLPFGSSVVAAATKPEPLTVLDA
jgi:SAM-dependent methyltransferase